jgi:hypothetical protein
MLNTPLRTIYPHPKLKWGLFLALVLVSAACTMTRNESKLANYIDKIKVLDVYLNSNSTIRLAFRVERKLDGSYTSVSEQVRATVSANLRAILAQIAGPFPRKMEEALSKRGVQPRIRQVFGPETGPNTFYEILAQAKSNPDRATHVLRLTPMSFGHTCEKPGCGGYLTFVGVLYDVQSGDIVYSGESMIAVSVEAASEAGVNARSLIDEVLNRLQVKELLLQ